MVFLKKVTARDVAQLAGVSQATVSMILNEKSDASFQSETVQRVFDAARSLNYPVRSPLPQQRNTIAVISAAVSNPYYSSLVQSIEQSAYGAGYFVFSCNTYRDKELEERYLRQIERMELGGIIFTFSPRCIQTVTDMSRNIPVVVIGDKSGSDNLDTVELDSFKSGIMLADHLVSLGHKRMAFITTPLDNNNLARTGRLEGVAGRIREMGAGYSLAVRSSELTIRDELGEFDNEHRIGYHLTKQVLKEEDVTAFIGVNDMVAYGIIDALQEEGLRVPEDYSVCGFDNIFPSKFRAISLTTVEHHIQYKGNNALDILQSKMKKRFTSPDAQLQTVMRVEYRPNLVARRSTAAPAR